MTTRQSEAQRKSPYTVTLDDDPLVSRLIAKITGMNSLPFASAAKLRECAKNYGPAAAFVDINLGMDECGLDIVPFLKQMWAHCPIIVVTSAQTSEAIGDALAAGADDFISKPFNQEELIARFRARRHQHAQLSEKSRIEFGDIVLFPLYRKLSGPEGEAFLSPIEQSIIRALIDSEGNLVRRLVLKRQVWGNVKVSDSALDRHIHGVRTKIKDTSQILKLRSVYGKGYVLQERLRSESRSDARSSVKEG